ncbi:MAG: hypothetical protein Q9M32_09130 [Sulfurimonas sp.]|nr:hypothetical protein [Sulfurimonas sp.]MDQ7059848.1 hypothetical protein [Sulfurimonas sp.]
MIASAFAYFNFKFSEYKFIDFKDWSFYEKSAIFKADADKYIVVFYSSKEKGTMDKLAKINLNLPILAIDYYNQVRKNSEHTTFLRSGTNNSLRFIQRFNIYEAPSIFFIKKSKDTLYKQDSMIRKLDNLDELSKQVRQL